MISSIGWYYIRSTTFNKKNTFRMRFYSPMQSCFHVCSVNSPRLAPISTYAFKDLNQDFIALIILVTWRHFYDHWQLTDSCPIQFKKHYLSPSVLILMSVLVFYYVEKKLTAQHEHFVGTGSFKLNINVFFP